MTVGELWRRLVFLTTREQRTEDLEEEMRLHVEERAARNREGGMEPAEAEHAARRRFGNRGVLGDRSREQWGLERAEVLMQDLRHAIRGLRRTPALTAMVVVTLALGLGVNGAMFSILDRVFVRPPSGVVDPGNVRRLYATTVGGDGPTVAAVFPYSEVEALVAGAPRSARVATYSPDEQRLGADQTGPRVGVSWTGAGYFSLLGIRFAMGRPFSVDEEHIESAPQVAVVGDRFWRDYMSSDPRAIGRVIQVGKRRYTVVGVAAPGFTGLDLDAVDIWLPLGLMPMTGCCGLPWYRTGNFVLSVVVRDTARDDRALEARETLALRRLAPIPGLWQDTGSTIMSGPLVAALGPAPRTTSVLISTRLAMVAVLVLIIACANVGNLLVLRALRRQREISVRLALGISRRRLASHFLVEGLVLALIAGGAALLVGALVATAMRTLVFPQIHWAGPPLDARVVAFTLAAAIGVGVLTGLAPVLQSRRLEWQAGLRSGAHRGPPRTSRLRLGLVVIQGALAVVLLVGAGAFVQSLRRVSAIDVGYDVDRLTFGLVYSDRSDESSAGAKHSAEQLQGLTQAAADLRRVRGIDETAVATGAPFQSATFVGITRPGRDSVATHGVGGPTYTEVSPEYFATTGVRLKQGRLFTRDDASQPVAIVSETMAALYWPADSPLGKCLLIGKSTRCTTVVGVVGDTHVLRVVDKPWMELYVPLTPSASGTALIVRLSPNGPWPKRRTILDEMRRVVPASAGTLEVESMWDQMAREFRPWRLGATLFSAFGVLALLVAAIGVYSVIAYAVDQRVHELGVRVALGAGRSDLVRIVLGETFRTVAGGVALGIVLSLGMGRIVAAMLYETSPRDPVILGVVALTLVSAAVLASLVPAVRAARVDPIEALREE